MLPAGSRCCTGSSMGLLEQLVEVRLVALVVVVVHLLLLLVSVGVRWVQVRVVLVGMLVRMRMRMLRAGGADGRDSADSQAGTAG